MHHHQHPRYTPITQGPNDDDAIWARRQPGSSAADANGFSRLGSAQQQRTASSYVYKPHPADHSPNNHQTDPVLLHQQQQPFSPYQQQTTVVHTAVKPVSDSDVYRCLYAFVLLLTIMIFINLAFTAWIMTVLNFNTEGIGALKIEEDRLRVLGKAEFEKPVQFSQLSTSGDEILTINSGHGVHISSHNVSGHSTASMNLRPDGKASLVCDRFEVLDPQKKLLFFVDSHEIGHKLENLRILDDGGSIFEGAIQTEKIRPEFDHPISLESPTRSLRVEAGQDIELLSGAGEISVNSLLDIRLNAKQGEVHIDSSAIYISGLEQSTIASQQKAGASVPAYQLCMCSNGRLFLAVERADCRGDRSICG